MIDYGDFQFACPLGAGGSWFYQAMKPLGIPFTTTTGGIYSPFTDERNGALLRVSMVCHPCTWLFKCFERRGMNRDFETYLHHYLRNTPGAVSRLFLSYEADSYMRAEDMPWAMYEFMEMIGHKEPGKLPPTTALRTICLENVHLRREIMKAEKGMADAFDYY